MAKKVIKSRIPRIVIIILILCAIFCVLKLMTNQCDVDMMLPILENLFQVKRFIEFSQEEDTKSSDNCDVNEAAGSNAENMAHIVEGENDAIYFPKIPNHKTTMKVSYKNTFQFQQSDCRDNGRILSNLKEYKIIESSDCINTKNKGTVKKCNLRKCQSPYATLIPYYAQETCTKDHPVFSAVNDKSRNISFIGTGCLCPTNYRTHQYLVYPILNFEILASYRRLVQTGEDLSFLTLAKCGFAYSGCGRELVCYGCDKRMDIGEIISDPTDAKYHNAGCPRIARPEGLSQANSSDTDYELLTTEHNPAQTDSDVPTVAGSSNTLTPNTLEERDAIEERGNITNVTTPSTVQQPFPHSDLPRGQNIQPDTPRRPIEESPDYLSDVAVHGTLQVVSNNVVPDNIPSIRVNMNLNFGVVMRTERIFCHHCFIRPAYYLVGPCKHICLCNDCSESLTKCLVCNGRIEELATLRFAPI